MKRPSAWLLFAVALSIAATAPGKVRNVTDPGAPRSLEDEGPVAVSWTDPAQFTEIRASGNRWEAQRGDWVRQLAEHLRERAAGELAPGERLDVVITDIDRAGSFEPWHGPNAQNVRIMRDIYRPRIDLRFTRYGADGEVVAEGERRLTDSGFMQQSDAAFRNDALAHEKRLLDDWVRRELRAPGA